MLAWRGSAWTFDSSLCEDAEDLEGINWADGLVSGAVAMRLSIVKDCVGRVRWILS